MKNINLFGSLTISAFLFSSLAFAGQSPIDDVEMEGDSNNVPYNLSAGAFDGNMVPIDALDVRDGFRVMRVPGIAIAVKDCALYGVMSQQGATEISNEQLVDIVDGKNKKPKIKKHFAAFFQIPVQASWIQRVANGDNAGSIIRGVKRVKSQAGKSMTFRIPNSTPVKYMANFLATKESAKAIVDGGVMATLVQPSGESVSHQVFIANELMQSAVLFNRTIDAAGAVSCSGYGVENAPNIATRGKEVLDAFRKVSYFVSK